MHTFICQNTLRPPGRGPLPPLALPVPSDLASRIFASRTFRFRTPTLNGIRVRLLHSRPRPPALTPPAILAGQIPRLNHWSHFLRVVVAAILCVGDRVDPCVHMHVLIRMRKKYMCGYTDLCTSTHTHTHTHTVCVCGEGNSASTRPAVEARVVAIAEEIQRVLVPHLRVCSFISM